MYLILYNPEGFVNARAGTVVFIQSYSYFSPVHSTNKAGMILGPASTLALKGNTDEAIELMERGLPLSINEKQKATIRAALCFLYRKVGMADRANRLASELPHARESREVIQPLIQ